MRRVAASIAYLLLFIGSAVPAAATDASLCPGGEPAAAEVEEVAEGVFVRQGVHELMSADNAGGTANIGFIIGNEAVAVIDTGGSFCDGQRLRLAIRERTRLPIKMAFNTHAHPDHIFGNAAFAEKGVEFVGHMGLKRDLPARADYYLRTFKDIMGGAFVGTRIIAPNLFLGDSARIDLGGRQLQVKAYPSAHTGADLTVYDEKTRTLFAGDLVFIDHIPVLDGKLKGWLSVMNKLAKIPALRVVPGHGPVSAGWPDALDAQRRYLTKLAADLRRHIANGGSILDAAAQVAVEESKRWRLHGDYHARNVNKGYAELEWE